MTPPPVETVRYLTTRNVVVTVTRLAGGAARVEYPNGVRTVLSASQWRSVASGWRVVG